MRQDHVEYAGEEPRWNPTGDRAEWVTATRSHLFDLIRRCVADAIGARVSDDVSPHDLVASDDVFRNLHACTDAAAVALYRLGQTPEQVVSIVLAGAAAAAEPDDLHPAVTGAIAQWCREADVAR
jgi:hypothetical protein